MVIGGGLLGLEAANALKQLGLETHVVEFAPNLMAVQLDNDGAAMLRRKIEALGVGVHTSKATTEIAATDDGLVLRFADGEQLETDMVVSLPVFVSGRAGAAAGWLSASAAGSALMTPAGPPIRTCLPSVNAPCGRGKSLGWWRRATRWRAWPPPRSRAKIKPSPGQI